VTAPDRPLKGAWGMTALIFLFMLINFADKVVVGLAAQPIMAELHLTPEQFGLIGSSFFFLFALSAVIVDDEQLARDELAYLLKNAGDVDVVALEHPAG
jgi:uncharacterized membrane protein